MNKKLILATCLCITSISLLYAAVPVESPVQAREQAKKDGVDCIILVHGQGWDRLGERFRKQIWDDSQVQNAMGSKTVSSVLQVPQNLSKEENDNFEKNVRKKVGANVRSMPGIVFFDAKGICYASISGNDLPANSNAVASRIRQIIKLRKKRDDLMEKAARAKGTDKAKFLCLAGEIRGINRHPDLVKEIKKCDPEDKTGYVRRLTFNIYDVQGKIKNLSKEEGLKIIDQELKTPRLTNEQKQKIYGLRGTFLRRNKATPAELKENYKLMHNLDPDSLLGKAAIKAAEAFAQDPKAKKK